MVCRIVKQQEHREGLEPSLPHYGCGILAAGRPVPTMLRMVPVSVGPEGLEPSPGGLRVRCAAASTLIPCSAFLTRAEWARRESNPQSDPYKRPALTVELRAAPGEWGRKDLNLHQPDQKAGVLPLHHDPRMQAGRMRFNRVWSMLLLLVSSGSRP